MKIRVQITIQFQDDPSVDEEFTISNHDAYDEVKAAVESTITKFGILSPGDTIYIREE